MADLKQPFLPADVFQRLSDIVAECESRTPHHELASNSQKYDHPMSERSLKEIEAAVDKIVKVDYSKHAKEISDTAKLLRDANHHESMPLEEIERIRDDLTYEVAALNAALCNADRGPLSLSWVNCGCIGGHRKIRCPIPYWPNMLYVFQTLSMMIGIVMCVAFLTGSMMGLFLSIMCNLNENTPISTRDPYMAILHVFLYPGLLLFASWFVFNCYVLLKGQLGKVSFSKCRAKILSALMKIVKGVFFPETNVVAIDEKKRLMYCRTAARIVDAWFVDFFLFSLVASALLGAMSTGYLYGISIHSVFVILRQSWGWATSAIFIWGLLTILLHMLSDLYLANDDHMQIVVRAVHNALVRYDVRPGCMVGKASRIQSFVFKQITVTDALRSARTSVLSEYTDTRPKLVDAVQTVPQRCGVPGGKNAFAIVLFVFSVNLALILWITTQFKLSNNIRILSIMFWITSVLVLYLWGFSKFFPNAMSSCAFKTSVCLLAVVLNIFLGAGLEGGVSFHVTQVKIPIPSKASTDAWVYRGSTDENTTRYPVCSMSWGAHEELRVVDLAILSNYAYDDNKSSLEINTQATFTDEKFSATILHLDDYYDPGRVVVFRSTKGSSARGTTVLVVKGSSTAYDFYADAGLWAMIASFQVFMPVVPLLDQLPNTLFAGILNLLPRTTLEKDIFNNINKTLRNLRKQYKDDIFLITGHSLGGGIAIAAGGSLQIPAVGFSGPGSHFSRWRFGTNLQDAFRSAVDIKPELDVVPMADRHDEMGQYIMCRDSGGERRDSGTCHMIGTTTCELWRVCGDGRGRDFYEMCHNITALNSTGKYLKIPEEANGTWKDKLGFAVVIIIGYVVYQSCICCRFLSTEQTYKDA